MMDSDPSDDFLPPDLDALGAEAVELGADAAPSPLSAVLAAHHDALMARAGVVMVGETIDAVGQPAILIGVRAARDMSRLPRQIDGVSVVTQVIGDVDAL